MTRPTTARPTADPRDVPWDLSFLRVGTLITAATAGVAALVAGPLAGWEHAAAIGVTAVIVTVFFAVSGLAVGFAGRIADTLTLPVALLAFGVKAALLFPLLTSLPEDGWLDRRTVGWSVVVGALLWSAVQLRWVWTRQLYYVPPPAAPSASSAGPVRPGPEKPGKHG